MTRDRILQTGAAGVVTDRVFGVLGEAAAYSLARDAKVAAWTYVNRLRE